MKLLIIALLFLFAHSANAQKNAGTADYAMLHSAWPCSLARQSENQLGLKTLRKAVLWNTFGMDTKCLEQYMADPRFALLELHLINEVCQRHGNCGDYEFLYGIGIKQYNEKLLKRDPGLISKLKEYFKAPSELLNSKLQSHTKCYISPGLESNLSKAAMKNLMTVVKPMFPNCEMVWNPVGDSPEGEPIRGTVFEGHGEAPALSPPCIANLDGLDISFHTRPAIMKQSMPADRIQIYFDRFKACESSFLWVAEFNGIASEEFIDPRKRSAFPSLETFNLVNGLVR